MANPFEDQDAPFVALQNALGEPSLWPAFLPPPAGWLVVAGPAPRDAALNLIETACATGDDAPARRAA